MGKTAIMKIVVRSRVRITANDVHLSFNARIRAFRSNSETFRSSIAFMTKAQVLFNKNQVIPNRLKPSNTIPIKLRRFPIPFVSRSSRIRISGSSRSPRKSDRQKFRLNSSQKSSQRKQRSLLMI